MAIDYKTLLEYSFKFNQETISPPSEREKADLDEAGVNVKIAWIGDTIFDFTTYDDSASMQFATKALEVCRAINDRKTFDYQALSHDHYTWYYLNLSLTKEEWVEFIKALLEFSGI